MRWISYVLRGVRGEGKISALNKTLSLWNYNTHQRFIKAEHRVAEFRSPIFHALLIEDSLSLPLAKDSVIGILDVGFLQE